MKKLILSVYMILAAWLCAWGQSVSGRVYNHTKQPLQGASVTWLGSRKGTITSETGSFSTRLPGGAPDTLLVSYAGYKTDTIPVNDSSFLEIYLKEQQAMTGVTVQSDQRGTYITNSPVKFDVISTLELKKAACCDLAGCFETQTTVQPQTTNIITNSKELRILGLSGIYNQVLIDGFPQIQGLTYTYGISSVPGPLVENIWVAKGANSVLQGFESISGQINVTTKDPGNTDKLLLNGYINSFGEKHLNVIYDGKVNRWKSVTALHMVQPAGRFDRDDDDFMDLPLLTRYMISTRWKKGEESKWGWSTQVMLRFLSERRVGGQTGFDYYTDKGGTRAYGQTVDISLPELWFKTAYRLNERHRFALYTSAFHQQQDSWFGVTHYDARQNNAYINLQYEWSYGGNNILKTGGSFRHLNLRENIAFSSNDLNRTYAGKYLKNENIAGAFAENTLSFANKKLIWIAGIRADHHNQFGWEITPRTLLKFDAAENFVIRSSVGKGWRTANIFSENTGMLVSSRNIIFAQAPEPEVAANMGINITHKFRGAEAEGYYSLDFYRTSFQNQLFPDYDTDPTKAIIKNFKGESVSNGFQAEVGGTFFKRAGAKLGYVFLDVYQQLGHGKTALPFNPKHRLNGAFSYMTLSGKWHADANIHWYGKQRLPDTKNNPPAYQMAGTSKPYSTLSLQFTYKVRRFEIYGGGENIFDFRQRRPIISWQDPFGAYFDTQFTWGPTRGRELYLGFRYIIPRPVATAPEN